jgi:hypothetical protein
MSGINSPITIELEGVEGVMEALDSLTEAFGPAEVNTVSLIDQGRDDGLSNVKLLNYLCYESEKPRNVVENNQSDSDKIANVFCDKIIQEIQNVMRKAEKRKAKGKEAFKGNESSVIKGLALRAAMNTYSDLVIKRIEDQVDFNGAPLAPLSESYAKEKTRVWGFATPILKASGQLIDALRASAVRAFIKLSKR